MSGDNRNLIIAIVLSVVAAALHWFISEQPLARPSAGQVTT